MHLPLSVHIPRVSSSEISYLFPDDIQGQTRQSLTNLSKILEEAGLTLGHVLKTTVFIQHMDDFAKMNEIYAEFFNGDVLPARSAVEVAKLPKGALVEIEAIASR